jgi:adenosine/AMP kinase
MAKKLSRSRSLSAEDWCQVVSALLAGEATPVEIVVEPLEMGGSRWWGVVAVVGGAERIELGKSRDQKTERKVWRKFETVLEFINESLSVERIQVETKPQ